MATRFEDSTNVAPEGASYAEILASLNDDERVTTTQLVAERGEAWVVRYWAFLRIPCLSFAKIASGGHLECAAVVKPLRHTATCPEQS